MTSLRGALGGLAVALAAMSVAAPPAGAHVVLVGSDPPDATSLTSVPRQVHLRFNEAVSPRFRQVRLLDGHGRTVRGTSVVSAADGRGLTLDLPAGLARGAYEVTWEALSRDDGHVTGGALVFGAGAPVGPAPRAAPAAGVKTLDAVLRWLWLALVLLAIGVTGFGVVLARVRVPEDRQPGRRRALARVARILAPAAALAAVAGLAVAVREVASVPGEAATLATAGRLLSERWGLLWAAVQLLLLGLVVAGLAVRRAPERRTPWIVSGALLAGVAIAHVANGHAATVGRPAAHVLAGAVHLLAAGVWLGGVSAFALALWPSAGSTREDAAAIARAVRKPFGALAGSALLVAVLTGLVAVGTQVASVDALLRTDYGSSLIVKSALMAGAGLIGLANLVLLMRVGPFSSGRVSRLMALEVAFGLGALLAAAEMTASAPPRGPEFGAPRPVHAPILAQQIQDVLVSATARPNRVGTNVFTVSTTDTRRVYGAPIRRVTLAIRPQAGGAARVVPLSATGGGRWTGGALLPSAGGWRMSVRVERPDGALVAPLQWRVEPADVVLPVRYSARRLAPIADRIALLLLAGSAAGALVLLVGRRRRPRRPVQRIRAIGKDTG